MRKSIEERFFEKVNKTTSCWLWTSTILRNGYGQFWVSTAEGQETAHRFAYRLFKGPIEAHKHIDHLCRVRNCVNPEHLEMTSGRENILRGEGYAAINARKTECVKGHWLELHSYTDSYNRRICAECKRIRSREVRLKKIKHRVLSPK